MTSFAFGEGRVVALVGGAACAGCHSAVTASHNASAHWRSLTTPVTNASAPLQRLITAPGQGNTLWPASTGAGNKLSFTTLCADGSTAGCTVYACNLGGGTSAKAYGFKFVKPANASSPTAGDCTVTTDGDVVPISGTYGGEGDRYVASGTSTELKDTGVYKQRFFAALADVPSTQGWNDYPAAEQVRDWIVFPIQTNQSGGQKNPDGTVVNAGARFAPYGALQNSWSQRGETFAQQCASCHNVGLQLSFNADRDVIAYNFRDFNITCEQCHGPGSEHVGGGGGRAKSIINPAALTPSAEVQTCGKCHAVDAATMKVPFGAGEMPWNQDRVPSLGNGNFIAGIHEIRDYIVNYDGAVAQNDIDVEAGFVAWPDGKHGQAHRQQAYELEHSVHMNNPVERVTCGDCHATHTLYQGPSSAKAVDATTQTTYDLRGTRFNDNSGCLPCHAGYGPFAGITKDDVGALVSSGGGQVFVNAATTPKTYAAADVQAAKTRIAQTVQAHMTVAVPGMGHSYQPEDENTPTGRCSSCHMARTGKSGGYWFTQNAQQQRAMLEGDEGSHVFDVVKQQDSAAIAAAAAAQPKPTTVQVNRYQGVMPNACAKCHDFARSYIP